MTTKKDNAYAPLFEKLRKNLEMSASNSNLSESDAMKIRVKAISEIRERWRSCTRTSINSFLRCCFLRSRDFGYAPEGFR